MTDVLTPEQRSRCMSRIQGKNTKPEMVVRRLAHALGYRFRLHRRNLPGIPDLVFPRSQKVIFVHGCFWHLHSCRYGRVVPQTNAGFWKTKREGNQERDARNIKMLRKLGWTALVIWECEARDLKKLERKILRFLAVD